MSHLSQPSNDATAVAVRIDHSALVDSFPLAATWLAAPPIHFSTDWQGKNADPERATEVRLLWSPQTLFLRFQARYRIITVFADADSNGRHDQLWDRDVVEAFIQPNPSQLRHYFEFEVSPNGFWIDLDIAPGEKRDLQSGLSRRVSIDERNKIWIAELSIPMPCFAEKMDPQYAWRINFFRVEGPSEPRFYSSWRPTNSPQPNFHVPEAFGELIFGPAAAKS